MLTECYTDGQPDLLSLLCDELDQERPRKIATLLSSSSGFQPPSANPLLILYQQVQDPRELRHLPLFSPSLPETRPTISPGPAGYDQRALILA